MDTSVLDEARERDATACVEESEVDTSELVEEDVDLGCPVLSEVNDVVNLKEEMRNDESLGHCRSLADLGKMGYTWPDELLSHRIVDPVLGAREHLVLPPAETCFRNLSCT